MRRCTIPLSASWAFLGAALAWAFTVSLLSSPLSALASDSLDVDTATDVIDVNREVGVAASGLYLDYREHQKGGLLDSDAGWTPGFSAKASYIWDIGPIDHTFAAVHYQFNNGDVYHQNFGSNVAAPHDNGLMINDVGLEFGKGILISPDLLLIPLAQADYRNWLRTFGPVGRVPQENYTFFAPGLGLRATYKVTSRLALTGKVGVEYTVSPTNSAAANPRLHTPDEVFNLRSEPLEQIELGYDYLLSPRLHGYGEIKYCHFIFGHSQRAGDGQFEPFSVTNQVSLQIGLAWDF
jgi:hypothetical protein